MIQRRINIALVARRQRLLIWCILAQVITLFLIIFGVAAALPVVAMAVPFLLPALALMALIGTVLLMSALRRHVVWCILLGLLMFVPLLGLLILISVNGQATRALQQAGVRVGFLGARRDDVDRVIHASLCNACGYDLTGNTSGRCPECSVAVQPKFCAHCGNDLTGNVLDECPGCGMPVRSAQPVAG